MQNPLIQTLLNNLKIKNPQGHQIVQNLMQSNGDPKAMLQQLMHNATPIVTQIPIITNATFNLSRSNT